MKEKLNDVISYTDEIYRVLDEVLFFVLDRYGKWMIQKIDRIVKRLGVTEAEKEVMFHQLIWMIVFCMPREDDGRTVYQHFLSENYRQFQNKDKNIQPIIESLHYIKPGFYQVLQASKRTGRVHIFTDILKKESKVVYDHNHKFKAPSSEDIVTGLLIPIDNEFSIIINRFIHFSDPTVREYIVSELSLLSQHEVLELDWYVSLLEAIFKLKLGMGRK